MKKIIFSLLILASVTVKAQTVATINFQAQDLAYLIGKNERNINLDSTTSTEFRKIRDQIRAANPASWTTNVILTNVPEWMVMAFYRTVKTANAGEIAARYTAITTTIEAKTQLSTQIATFNQKLSGTPTSDYERTRDAGKYIVMDQ
jgi:hypothetical protein